ncbi:hypothetical protein FA15DRAFT_679197 [Coprinopsis marcescibilis]|uniref:Protein BIG1 n=1 Tax=Coprinopsis marcescibilis TaxID=230819 RepID=A0A5C3LEU0_COPMA|nr:hypothetical protein FA15DRAFT_679197 [Coprinopsis marcescibilis]
MTRHFILLAAIAPLAFAYSNTAPLLAWSSLKSNAIDTLPSTVRHASTILDAILNRDEICDYDAVVLVQHAGVHASDLRTLSPESEISRALKESPSTRSYPYLQNDRVDYNLPLLAPNVAKQCNSRLVTYTPGDSGIVLDSSEKHTIVLDMPRLHESGEGRSAEMKFQGNILADELSSLAVSFPKHLVVYAGLALDSHFARADSVFNAPSNTTLPEGGILKRYQLLTPGLITVLLIVLFVFLPVLFVAINALAAIQNPIKMNIPKGFNAQDRKNQ